VQVEHAGSLERPPPEVKDWYRLKEQILQLRETMLGTPTRRGKTKKKELQKEHDNLEVDMDKLLPAVKAWAGLHGISTMELHETVSFAVLMSPRGPAGRQTPQIDSLDNDAPETSTASTVPVASSPARTQEQMEELAQNQELFDAQRALLQAPKKKRTALKIEVERIERRKSVTPDAATAAAAATAVASEHLLKDVAGMSDPGEMDPAQAAAAATVQGGINGAQAHQEFAAQDAAALTLQGGMAGTQARQDIANQDAAALQVQAGITGMQARKDVAGMSCEDVIDKVGDEEEKAGEEVRAVMAEIVVQGSSPNNSDLGPSGQQFLPDDQPSTANAADEWEPDEEDEECAFAPGSPTGRQGTDLMAAKKARGLHRQTLELKAVSISNDAHHGDAEPSPTLSSPVLDKAKHEARIDRKMGLNKLDPAMAPRWNDNRAESNECLTSQEAAVSHLDPSKAQSWNSDDSQTKKDKSPLLLGKAVQVYGDEKLERTREETRKQGQSIRTMFASKAQTLYNDAEHAPEALRSSAPNSPLMGYIDVLSTDAVMEVESRPAGKAPTSPLLGYAQSRYQDAVSLPDETPSPQNQISDLEKALSKMETSVSTLKDHGPWVAILTEPELDADHCISRLPVFPNADVSGCVDIENASTPFVSDDTVNTETGWLLDQRMLAIHRDQVATMAYSSLAMRSRYEPSAEIAAANMDLQSAELALAEFYKHEADKEINFSSPQRNHKNSAPMTDSQTSKRNTADLQYDADTQNASSMLEIPQSVPAAQRGGWGGVKNKVAGNDKQPGLLQKQSSSDAKKVGWGGLKSKATLQPSTKEASPDAKKVGSGTLKAMLSRGGLKEAPRKPNVITEEREATYPRDWNTANKAQLGILEASGVRLLEDPFMSCTRLGGMVSRGHLEGRLEGAYWTPEDAAERDAFEDQLLARDKESQESIEGGLKTEAEIKAIHDSLRKGQKIADELRNIEATYRKGQRPHPVHIVVPLSTPLSTTPGQGAHSSVASTPALDAVPARESSLTEQQVQAQLNESSPYLVRQRTTPATELLRVLMPGIMDHVDRFGVPMEDESRTSDVISVASQNYTQGSTGPSATENEEPDFPGDEVNFIMNENLALRDAFEAQEDVMSPFVLKSNRLKEEEVSALQTDRENLEASARLRKEAEAQPEVPISEEKQVMHRCIDDMEMTIRNLSPQKHSSDQEASHTGATKQAIGADEGGAGGPKPKATASHICSMKHAHQTDRPPGTHTEALPSETTGPKRKKCSPKRKQAPSPTKAPRVPHQVQNQSNHTWQILTAQKPKSRAQDWAQPTFTGPPTIAARSATASPARPRYAKPVHPVTASDIMASQLKEEKHLQRKTDLQRNHADIDTEVARHDTSRHTRLPTPGAHIAEETQRNSLPADIAGTKSSTQIMQEIANTTDRIERIMINASPSLCKGEDDVDAERRLQSKCPPSPPDIKRMATTRHTIVGLSQSQDDAWLLPSGSAPTTGRALNERRSQLISPDRSPNQTVHFVEVPVTTPTQANATATGMSAKQRESAVTLFRRMDPDRNGRIHASELADFFAAWCVEGASSAMMEAFPQLRRSDNTGSIGVSEWLVFVRSLGGPAMRALLQGH